MSEDLHRVVLYKVEGKVTSHWLLDCSLTFPQKHRKRGKSRLDRLGIPEEELARQQQQLFDEARQQHLEVSE